MNSFYKIPREEIKKNRLLSIPFPLFYTFASVMEKRETEHSLFSKLFEQYKESFILFANSYVRDKNAAEDIYMEAIIQYWEKRKELPADTNIAAYILTCIKHKALNYLRHLNIKTDVEDELYEHRTRELNFRITSLEACDPSELYTEEIGMLIRQTLDELPEQTRRVFHKSRWENKTNKEIAAELGLNIKTVEFHISKALKLFRLRLKDYLPLFLLLFGPFNQ